MMKMHAVLSQATTHHKINKSKGTLRCHKDGEMLEEVPVCTVEQYGLASTGKFYCSKEI